MSQANLQSADKNTFFAQNLPSRLSMTMVFSMAFTYERSVNLLSQLSHGSRAFLEAEKERLEL